MINAIKTKKMFLIFVLILGIAAMGLLAYNVSLKDDLVKQTCASVEEAKQQQCFSLKNEMEVQLNSIENVGEMLSAVDPDIEFTADFLHNMLAGTKFDYVIFSNLNGEAIASNGQSLNLVGKPVFQKNVTEETVVAGPVKSLITGEDVLILSTPIKRNGKPQGILYGAYAMENFKKVFLPFYNGTGYIFVVDANGKVIVETKNKYMITASDNLFEEWTKRGTEFYRFEDLDHILENVKDGKGGHASYRIEGKNRLTHYGPVGINDWQMFATVPETALMENIANITKKTAYLTAVLIFCFGIAIVYLFILQRKFVVMHKNKIDQLEDIAYIDQLTRIYNFNKFQMEAQKIFNERREASYVLMKFDIENFKVINNLYGFEKGDEILKAVAQMMMKNLKNEHELCARINTDEFVALLEFENYEKFVTTCRNFTHDFYVKLGKNLGQSVKFPAGYYVSIAKKDERSDILALFEKATIAHKAAKKNKDVKFIEYNKTLALEVLREKEIESKMENALLQEKFQVYLQAKYSLADETLGGAEALVRWDDENKDLFYPGAFIELFEKNGFIKKLDMYMLKQVCKMMKEWMDKGIEPITVSVNFSRVHLVNRNLVEDICKITDDYGIPRSCIQIELTETAIFDNLMVLQGVILQLHNAGLTIAMDDFGSGYSSLGLLKDLQVDVIKLDRSFFADPKYKTRTKTVVRNVIKMAGELGIVVVAEGVETEDHVLLLKELECDMIQGYYYGKPMPANALNLTGKGIAQIKHEKTPFQFSSIGNISLGRGALGTDMPVFVYRLFQFTMRQALSDIYGEGEMIDAFRQSGKIAGKAFAQEFLDLKLELQEFTVNFKEKFEQSKIGILKIEAIDQRKEKIVLTIEEDVSCSGISVYEIRNQICKYEEGFLQGVFGEYTGREYFAVEVDCWGTGAKLCRFVVSEK